MRKVFFPFPFARLFIVAVHGSAAAEIEVILIDERRVGDIGEGRIDGDVPDGFLLRHVVAKQFSFVDIQCFMVISLLEIEEHIPVWLNFCGWGIHAEIVIARFIDGNGRFPPGAFPVIIFNVSMVTVDLVHMEDDVFRNGDPVLSVSGYSAEQFPAVCSLEADDFLTVGYAEEVASGGVVRNGFLFGSEIGPFPDGAAGFEVVGGDGILPVGSPDLFIDIVRIDDHIANDDRFEIRRMAAGGIGDIEGSFPDDVVG